MKAKKNQKKTFGHLHLCPLLVIVPNDNYILKELLEMKRKLIKD